MGQDITEHEQLMEKWRGEGKVKSIGKSFLRRGTFRYHFQEGRANRTLDFKDEHSCDLFIKAFGGKNEETCSTDPIFLNVMDHQVEDFLERGHVLKGVAITGKNPKQSHKDRTKILIPKETGSTALRGKMVMVDGQNDFLIKSVGFIVEVTQRTRQFETVNEAENFYDFLKTSSDFEDFNFPIGAFVTFSKDTGQFCKWVRRISGDGTKTIEMQLHYLDRVFFQKCLPKDIYSAAGDMYWKECMLMDIDEDQDPRKNWLCEENLKKGLVDRKGKRTTKGKSVKRKSVKRKST